MKFGYDYSGRVSKHKACSHLVSRQFVYGFAGSFISAAVIAFAIATPATSATAQSAAISSTATSGPGGDAEHGKRLFVRDGCYECHGREAQGGGINGPRIAPNPIPYQALLAFVRHPAGEMPPFSAKVLSEKDLADIYAYLLTIPQPPPVDSIPILRH